MCAIVSFMKLAKLFPKVYVIYAIEDAHCFALCHPYKQTTFVCSQCIHRYRPNTSPVQVVPETPSYCQWFNKEV